MNRKERTQALLQAYKQASVEEKREIEGEIILVNEALCADIVWKCRNIPIEVEDAMQVARIGMLKAIRAYDGRCEFSTLAVNVMVRDLINIRTKSNRSKRTAHVISMEKPLREDETWSEILSNDVDVASQSTDRLLVKEIFRVAPIILKDKEYPVFLFAIEYLPHTRKSLAKELGIVVPYVTTLKKRALDKIRHHFKDWERDLA